MNIAALLAGLFSGILGAMGLGGGAVLIIYLTLFTETDQLTAQGINLLFFIPCALLAVTIYAFKRKIKWRITLRIAAWGILGTALGLSLTSFLGGDITAKIFGALLIIIGVMEIFKRKPKNVAESKNK